MRSWFTMKKAEDGDSAEIMIYDAIGQSFWDDSTVSAKSFVTELEELGDVSAITLRINSPGGDVFDGVAIYNAIKNHKATVTAQVDGIAASAASLVAMAADKIVMPSNAFMLIHNAAGFAMGNADVMVALAADLERIDKSMTATYAARSGQTRAKVASLMKEDRLMDAAEAKELGYADEITAPVKMAAKFSLRLLPKVAAERFSAEVGQAQDPEPEVPEQPVVPPKPPAEPVEPVEEPETETKPAQTAQVIDIKTAKAEGIAEHRAYVAEITDMCTLARASDRVGTYVLANTPVEQVRKELLSERPNEPAIMPHRPITGQTPQAATQALWTKITDKINARRK